MLKYLERGGANDAFSLPHTLSYSLIAMIQLNLNLYYNPLYWAVACLIVNSGSTESEGSSKTVVEYGKIAKAIGELSLHGVKTSLPDINKAKYGFTPDIENNTILFGLRSVNGIGNAAQEIIKNRPFKSFEDFYERMYKTKLIQKTQFIKLIKSGAFNSFDNPVEIMTQFLVKEVDVKDSLNGQNLPRVISLGLFDDTDLISFKHLYNFKSYINKKIYKTTTKPKDKILILDVHAQSFFFANFTDESVEGWHDNKPLISAKKFKKEYDQKMSDAMELISTPSFVKRYNQAQFIELWNEHTGNKSVESWEMESVSFYSDKHELADIDYQKYNLSDFSALSEEPIVEEKFEWRGRTMKNYQLSTIAGTILDKDSNKNTVSLLTVDGNVVNIKFYKGSFSAYDKQIKINGKIEEKSWFSRGVKIIVTGYRRQDQFIPKAPKGEHTINKIVGINADNSLQLQAERFRV